MFNRRSLMLAGSAGLATAGTAGAQPAAPGAHLGEAVVDVRHFGARGDGATIDSPAINRAIEYAAARGGGTVLVPAGNYACYSIRLKSRIMLHLEAGAAIIGAETPADGSVGGYDLAEPQGPWEPYQDYGHNHWHNSLIWGEGLENIAITGSGLIWGKGLNAGTEDDGWIVGSTRPGTANKAIGLKNCRNVLLRDFRVLQGGWFALLATGVDNLTIDNLLVDTNRDGFDIDCCRNVRITNCTVNSPWDDGICPKSSYALGYPRATENLTIANCFVTGNYQLGSVLDGTWKQMLPSFAPKVHGRIKLGTESNGGFTNIAITNCVFDQSCGFALETVDGAICEDITISNVTMRGSFNSPFFLRLGRRMRGPAGRPIGTLKRVLISNVTSSGAVQLPSIIAGLPGHPVEDVQINDVFLDQRGGAGAVMAVRQPPLEELGYPEPTMFGDLPATGFYIRNARNIAMSNVEVAVDRSDARPAFWLKDVAGADFFRLRMPPGPAFALADVSDFRSFGSFGRKDRMFGLAASENF